MNETHARMCQLTINHNTLQSVYSAFESIETLGERNECRFVKMPVFSPGIVKLTINILNYLKTLEILVLSLILIFNH